MFDDSTILLDLKNKLERGGVERNEYIIANLLKAGGSKREILKQAVESLRGEVDDERVRLFLSDLIGVQERFGAGYRREFSLFDMPWPTVNESTKKSIEDSLGEKVKILPLQSDHVLKQHRIKCLNGKAWSLATLPWLVKTESGKKYKLLKWSGQNELKHLSLVDRIKRLEDINFSPNLLDSGKHYLLLEYREGDKIDPEGDDFPKKLGQCLAELHKADTGFISAEQMLFVVDSYFDSIKYYDPFCPLDMERIRQMLTDLLPQEILTGIVYADLKPDNFLIDDKGELFFPDIGSFQFGQPIDVFLNGNTFVSRSINSCFSKAYLDNGGVESVLQDNLWMRLVGAVKLAEFYIRIHSRFSFLNYRKKRNYRIWYAAEVDKIKSMLSH